MSSAQLVVIGAGPGGYAAAFYAADLGMQVTLVDPEPNPGGVCLYRGCIPSKALLHVANLLSEAKHAAAWGITTRSDDRPRQAARIQGRRRAAHGGRPRAGLQAAQDHVSPGHGRVDERDELEVALVKGGSESLTFEHAILATGSRPATVPGLSIDSPRVMDSTGALDLPDVPASLLVVGGGYIGLELGRCTRRLARK